MEIIIKHSLRFLFVIFVQSLILNQLEIGFGTQIMIYPLFIFLLPFEFSPIILMFVAFITGILIDSISDTYGLHASSLVVFAFFRPIIFKLFESRDGYDNTKESNIFEMGGFWFITTFGILLLIHHFWFFIIEMFRVDALIFVLIKTILSATLSFLSCYVLQLLFIKKPKER